MGVEQGIQNAILDYLTYRGIPAWRVNAGAVKTEAGRLVRLAPVGHSDIALVLPGGRAGFVEVKTARGRLSEHQRAFLDRMAAAGAWTLVARSVEDVAQALEVA